MIDDRTVGNAVVSVFVTTVGRLLVEEMYVSVVSVLISVGVLVTYSSV